MYSQMEICVLISFKINGKQKHLKQSQSLKSNTTRIRNCRPTRNSTPRDIYSHSTRAIQLDLYGCNLNGCSPRLPLVFFLSLVCCVVLCWFVCCFRSPVHNVMSLLTSIQSLLTDPNISSPANPEAAKLYGTDKKAYRKRVRACVAKCTG